MIPVQLSKYGENRVNPMYQVDFSCLPIGKYFAATKLCIRFRFGFINADAIAKGWSGADCRGKEHVIELIWSLNSGKRIIFADGKEVHYSRSKHKGKRFEFSGTIAGNHMIQIVAHATPGQLSTSGFGQFDLLVDGCSYFDSPRIYELGKKEPSKEFITHETESIIPTVPTTNSPPSSHESLQMKISLFDSFPPGCHLRKASKLAQEKKSRGASQPAVVYGERISDACPTLASNSRSTHGTDIKFFDLTCVSKGVMHNSSATQPDLDECTSIEDIRFFTLVANQMMSDSATPPWEGYGGRYLHGQWQRNPVHDALVRPLCDRPRRLVTTFCLL